MLMISKEFKAGSYQRKQNIIKRNRIFKKTNNGLKAFQNIVAIFIVNSINSKFFCFYM